MLIIDHPLDHNLLSYHRTRSVPGSDDEIHESILQVPPQVKGKDASFVGGLGHLYFPLALCPETELAS